MCLKKILPLQWKSTPYVVADHYRKKKSSNVEQIDYAGHIAANCPHRLRRQVNQLTDSTKPESISLGMSDSSNSPSLSNKFEILSQLEEELND